MERGTVVALDRSSGVVQVALHSGNAVVPAMWLAPEPPPPRSVVWVEFTPNGGHRVCLGAEGKQRQVMHEDFYVGYKGAVVGFHIPLISDLEWSLLEPGGAAGHTGYVPSTNNGTAGATQFDRAGQVVMTANAGAPIAVGNSSTALRTSLNIDQQWLPTGVSFAHWATITAMLPQTANCSVQMGWSTSNLGKFLGGVAGDRRVVANYDSAGSANWRLVVSTGAGDTIVDTGYAATINEWVTFDLILQCPGAAGGSSTGWAAMYINGTFAAYTASANVPGPGSLGQPCFAVYPRAAVATGLHMDRFTTHIVSPLRQPFPDQFTI